MQKSFWRLLWGNFIRALVVILAVLLVISYFVAAICMAVGFLNLFSEDRYAQATFVAILFVFWLSLGMAVGVTAKELE